MLQNIQTYFTFHVNLLSLFLKVLGCQHKYPELTEFTEEKIYKDGSESLLLGSKNEVF